VIGCTGIGIWNARRPSDTADPERILGIVATNPEFAAASIADWKLGTTSETIRLSFSFSSSTSIGV
jgi:hypothetical protein